MDSVLRLLLVLKVISRGSHDQKVTEEIRPGGPVWQLNFGNSINIRSVGTPKSVVSQEEVWVD